MTISSWQICVSLLLTFLIARVQFLTMFVFIIMTCVLKRSNLNIVSDERVETVCWYILLGLSVLFQRILWKSCWHLTSGWNTYQLKLYVTGQVSSAVRGINEHCVGPGTDPLQPTHPGCTHKSHRHTEGHQGSGTHVRWTGRHVWQHDGGQGRNNFVITPAIDKFTKI